MEFCERTRDGLLVPFDDRVASATVRVTDRLIDLPAAQELALGVATNLAMLIAPDAAPVGGIAVTITSSNPSIVEVLTPTVTIPEGSFIAQVSVRATGLGVGAATITASAAGFAPDVSTISVTSALNILETFVNFSELETDNILLQLESGGSPFPAPVGGVTVSLTSSNTNCVVVNPSIMIAEGDSLGTATLTFAGVASLPCSATVTATSALFGIDTIPVTICPSLINVFFISSATIGSSSTNIKLYIKPP